MTDESIFAAALAITYLSVRAAYLDRAFLLGLLTRFAAVTMIIDMLVAISTTKVPMLLNEGFWKMAHEARTDWAMLLGSIFLLLVGAGVWSLDAWFSRGSRQS
jgi:uncharacterized membrane protein YphA (DoxX/SURF4 family)